MPINIGKYIKAEVEAQRFTQKEFGALIHRHEKTVPDIYDRTDPCVELLMSISSVLKKDFFAFYYEVEPLKSLRNDRIKELERENGQAKDAIKQLEKELSNKQELIQILKDHLNTARELLAVYKRQQKNKTDTPH